MAKARAIAKRRKAVQNIRKITRTMQLIATARFQAAYNRATATKPYTEHISKLVEQLSRGLGDIDHPLLQTNEGVSKSALIVLTSNRGLCGGYNAALLRKAMEFVRCEEAAGRTVDLHVVGKKGVSSFKFHRRPMVWTETTMEGNPSFDRVNEIAAGMIDAYERKQIHSCHVAYTKYASPASQYPEVAQLLPISRPGQQEDGAIREPVPVQYEFSPAADVLLAELLPEVVRVRLFQFFNDAVVSEHTARMVAMKSATDAAEDMIKSLTQRLNRARQSQITLELLDIVAGAEALA